MSALMPESLVNLVIRPPRAHYTLAQLLPSRFELDGREFRRDDLTVDNARGLPLACR